MDGLSLISTEDGSHTIRNEIIGETYHSIHGAIQESEHVFIQSGLQYFLKRNSAKAIRIIEIGFGTGLNAFLTYKAMLNSGVLVEYFAFETNPLPKEIYAQLNYDSNGDILRQMHDCEWEAPIRLFPNFTLTKLKQRIQSASLDKNFFNVVYYDAFAPNTQPEMWTLDIFEKLGLCMTKSSVLVTYSAKGQVKRDLKSAGFIVERIPGPPGKREMLRALHP